MLASDAKKIYFNTCSTRLQGLVELIRRVIKRFIVGAYCLWSGVYDPRQKRSQRTQVHAHRVR